VSRNGWFWVENGGGKLKQLVLGEIGWWCAETVSLGQNGWCWVKMIGVGSKRVVGSQNGWCWLKLGGGGLKWLVMPIRVVVS